MDKKLRETTNLFVEIMGSKRQVKGKLGHVVQTVAFAICRLTINHSIDLCPADAIFSQEILKGLFMHG